MTFASSQGCSCCPAHPLREAGPPYEFTMIAYRLLLRVAGVAVVCLATVMMLMVSTDILLRYALAAPLRWGYDAAALLFVWLSMLALPLAVNGGQEPTPMPQTLLARIGLFVQVIILVAAGWAGLARALVSYSAGTLSLDNLPQIWFDAALPCGCFLAALVLLCRLVSRGRAQL